MTGELVDLFAKYKSEYILSKSKSQNKLSLIYVDS